MSKTNYIPQPIDTSDIQLPEELNPLARNVMMPKSIIPVLSLTRTFLKKKRCMTAIHP